MTGSFSNEQLPVDPETRKEGSTAMMDSDVEHSKENGHVLASTTEPVSPRSIHGIYWILVVVGNLSSILLYALDNTIVANIIPAIVDRLGHVEQLAWLSVGFMIGGVSVALPVGRLYGIFNAKWLYIISVILFMAGSALCGAAPNMAALIVGRVIAGAGGNGMYVGVVTILSVNTSEKERPSYLGLIGLVYGIGTVVGPVLGGAFAESAATWRWGFYINLVVGGVFTPVYLLLLPSFDPRPNTKYSTRFRDFDYLGATLSIGVLVTLIMAINFGGTLYAWNSGQTIALFTVSGVLLIFFGVQQALLLLTHVDHRMFPVHFLKMKEPVLLFILAAANNAAAFVLMYYIPLYFQFTRGNSPLNSGVRLLALIIAVTITIMVNGGVMSKFGYYQPWYLVGSVLVLIGGVLISRITIDTAAGHVYGLEILLGIGVGSYLQAGYAVIQGVLDPTQMAYGVTFMLLGQLSGIALGLSISGAIFVNRSLASLSKILPDVPRQQLQSAISGTSGDFFKQLPASTQDLALGALMSSLQTIFILVYVAGAVGIVCSLFLSRKKLVLAPAAGA